MSGLGEVLGNLKAWETKVKAGILGTAKVGAANMQNYARENKSWKDITGNARAGLHAGAFWQNPFCIIVYLAHAVEYGVFLELAHDSQYEILRPTVDKFAPEIHQNIKKLSEFL